MRRKIGYDVLYDFDKKRIDDYYDEIENRFETGLYPKELGNRFELCEERGVIGWSKEERELSFRLWEEIPNVRKIEAADRMAKKLDYNNAFFELYTISFGGPETYFITWTLEALVSWAMGKGLDWLFQTIKDEKFIEDAKTIGEDKEFIIKDGKLYIKVCDIPNKGKATIEICRYPEVVKEINDDVIRELKELMLKDEFEKHYIYSREGKKFIIGQAPSKHLSVDI